MKYEKDTASYEDLQHVPFKLIEVFHRLEEEPKLSKKRQYKRLEDEVDRYIELHNRRIGDGSSADYIFDRDKYQKMIRDSYDKFTAMMSRRLRKQKKKKK